MSFDSNEHDEDRRFLVDKTYSTLTQHRGLLWVVVAIGTIWMLGYVLDVVAGPYNESTRFVHIVSGLLGTAAVIFVLCSIALGLLWGAALVVTRVQSR